MQELIKQMEQDAGLSPEKAQVVLNTIASFAKERFPAISMTIDKVLGDASTEISQFPNNNTIVSGDLESKL